ncbi:LOW QUALITY PROTEIN: uncharacterized protein LOC114645498 [Rhizophagus clarus]|uniref:LOW QUALITY PROTEIN: uncharacterized protein LOC114645498 n=1 Tax=Rhizophagus clarus TaxID=94130 RepID=A0A8H3L3J2_9GLOM|nr:LOW QUALITY PROTEIN: uncharacterized protein LOC114645498 [Rhizophagus clarus]
MTYNSLQEIENAFAEPSLQSQLTTSRVIISATLRKQKSRATLTEEQNANILTQDRISHQIHYATKQEHCHALKWKNESKGFYCSNGQIILAPLSPSPQHLHSLLTTNDPITNEPYVNQIRAYNQVLAFTSLDANIDENLANAKDGIYTFSLMPSIENSLPSFA